MISVQRTTTKFTLDHCKVFCDIEFPDWASRLPTECTASYIEPGMRFFRYYRVPLTPNCRELATKECRTS